MGLKAYDSTNSIIWALAAFYCLLPLNYLSLSWRASTKVSVSALQLLSRSVLPILSFTYSVVPSFSPEIKDLANLELSPCLPLFLCMMTDNPCWHTDLHPTLSCRTLDTLLMVQSILLISQAQTHNKTIGNAPLIFYLNKMARSPN